MFIVLVQSMRQVFCLLFKKDSLMDIGCTKTTILSIHQSILNSFPKHSSKYIEQFLEEKGVNWWYTPPESPDLNPIELVWGSLKEYLRNRFKPKNLEELKTGIERFWLTLIPEVCRKYISHLKKVIPKIVSVGGGPSGY